MFGTWLRVDTTATYRKLARALVAVGKRNVAEAICIERGMKVTTLECSYYYTKVYVHCDVRLGGCIVIIKL